MNSHYFPQYLLNKGIIKIEDMAALLRKCADTEPGICVLALQQGLAAPDQLGPLMGMAEDEVVAALTEKGILTADKVKELKEAETGKSLAFAEVLLEEKVMSLEELAEQLKAYAGKGSEPLFEALEKFRTAELEEEYPLYKEFAELFISSLARFMDTPAVVNICDMEPGMTECDQTYIASQSLIGDINLVTGVYASREVFLEMARSYSHEDIPEVNEMATDSVTEFLNVLNGIYLVELSKREVDADLDTPRFAENQEPLGNRQLLVRLETGLGGFILVMAADEFIFG